MKKSIASLVFVGIFFGSTFVSPIARAQLRGSEESPVTAKPDPLLVEKWRGLDGRKISRLQFVGLKRTLERSVRWLMQSTEGAPFSSYQLAIDIQTLFNTNSLYNIDAKVELDPSVLDQVQITLTLIDKWTLFPDFGSQGGGGAFYYGGGIFDRNLLGTFTLADIFFFNYNGVPSYDVLFSNEFIGGSNTMASLDWSNTVAPTTVYNINNTSAGSFTWQRQQEEVMVGTHLRGPIRIYIYGDYYYDALQSATGVNAFVLNGNQYRLHPVVTIDRVNIIEFLEIGKSIKVQPSAANFLGPVQAYQGLDVRYKQVLRVGDEGNFAFDFFAGAMSSTPPPYEYQVGGYSNVRGYANNRQMGPYTAFGNIEYRPLIYKHRFGSLFDWDVFNIDMVALQGCLFSDFGSAWGDSTLTGDPGSQELNVLWSVGAGFRVNFLHYAGSILRLDLARTIRPDEGWGLSFGIGQFF